MFNEITEKQRDIMRYRRVVIKDKLRDIEQLITGRAEGYLPLISGENGRAARENTERFIAEMLDALRRYIKFTPNRTLDEDSVKMYESFLYCAVMSLDFERSLRAREVLKWKIPSVFEDIVRRAEKVDIVGCGSYDDYLRDCYFPYRSSCEKFERSEFKRIIPNVVNTPSCASPKDTDFFIAVKRSLKLLGCPHFIEGLPEETRLGLSRDYEKKYASEERVAEEQGVPWNVRHFDDYDEMMMSFYAEQHEKQCIAESLKYLEDDKSFSEMPYKREDIVAVSQDISEEELLAVKAKWKEFIVFDEKTLCEHFYNFARLYFDSSDRVFFVENVENMVDTYLFEHGISAFSIVDDYAIINYFVDRTKHRIERETERGKRK